MSLTEAKFEEQPYPMGSDTSLAADLFADGFAQFPVRLTSGSMNDGEMMAKRLADTLLDPRLYDQRVDIGMITDPSDPTGYLVTFTLSQLLG